jgi:translocation and assembly module TamB
VKGDLAGEFKRAGASFGQLDGVVALPRVTQLASLRDTTALQPLTGTVHLQFRDLGPLALVTPAIEHLAGKLDLQATAAGHLRAPELTARVTLADGAADIPPAGLKLRAIELTAEGDQHQLSAQGRLQSGSGFLALTAKAPRIDADSLELQVKVQGERFTVMDTPEVEALISPDLEAAVVGRKAEVRGEVVIPFARIELKQIPPSAQGVSGDVEFVDAEAEEEKPPIEVTADVRVALGDSVSFSGYGFSSRFAGGVQVIERPGRPTSASGELRVEEGKYQAYGQNLTVGTWGDSLMSGRDPGRIIFAGGPADNPGLDLRAFREAEDGTIAGLHILGTAKRPEITLFSDPAMPDGDVLSYIMLGRKPGESGGDSSLLANAAVGMGLSRGNVMARSLGSKVGLDQAGIESEGGIDEATLVTGKYLSPKLYVSHGYGLFDRVNTFRARYLLKKQVTVQAETGEGTGGDILYRLERGR